MTIDQVYDKLNTERTTAELIPCRIPFRVIMVSNIKKYRELVNKLRQIPDVSLVSAGELFSAPDIMPRYENLNGTDYHSKWVILTGVSEYLRLFSHNEVDTARLKKLITHQVPASSTGRIIIPLWGCEALWQDSTLRLMADERMKDYYFDCTSDSDEDQKLTVTVYSAQFLELKDRLQKPNILLFSNLQEWYDFWADGKTAIPEYALITGRSHLIQQTTGTTTIHVVKDNLSFIQENLNGSEMLNTDNCPIEVQKELFEQALQHKTLDDAILSCLNVSSFQALDIMGKWSILSTNKKELVRLWYRLNPDNTYLSHCILKCEKLDALDEIILHDIFSIPQVTSKWIAESQQIIAAMKLKRDNVYFDFLSKIPSYEARLDYLSCDTSDERIYLLKMVGQWLREDKNAVYGCQRLKTLYPELFEYLDGTDYSDEELRRYMELYKIYKLSNTLPADEQMYFAGIQTDQFDSRFAELSDYIDDQTVVLWVDALGAEWLPLLLKALAKRKDGTVVYHSCGLAKIPTETKFNDQWNQMDVPYEKIDYLDKLAHKGLSYKDIDDYYPCIEEQFTVVSEKHGTEKMVTIGSKISELLKNYRRIIITGDHGTSRLAARFFHTRQGIPAPKEITVGSHGRFGVSSKAPGTKMETQIVRHIGDESYIVFTNYDHYIISGHAAGADDDVPTYGEIHGGATPEELLVPIIVFDSNSIIPLQAEWEKNPVKIQNKKANAVIKFNQSIASLQINIGSIPANVTATDDKKVWKIVFENIKHGKYTVSIIANGKSVQADELIINSAIGNNDGDFDL